MTGEPILRSLGTVSCGLWRLVNILPLVKALRVISTTYKLLQFSGSRYFHDVISTQPPQSTRSSPWLPCFILNPQDLHLGYPASSFISVTPQNPKPFFSACISSVINKLLPHSLADELYCVGGDVKPSSINLSMPILSIFHVLHTALLCPQSSCCDLSPDVNLSHCVFHSRL